MRELNLPIFIFLCANIVAMKSLLKTLLQQVQEKTHVLMVSLVSVIVKLGTWL